MNTYSKWMIVFAMGLFSLSSNAKNYTITDFGAVQDETIINTTAIQTTIDKAFSDGGGIVTIPSGKFLTSTIHLKSNVTIQLEPGSVLLGVPELELYKDEKALIYAENQHDIAIIGSGNIDGQGNNPNFQSDDVFNGLPGRPSCILIKNCQFILLENFKLVNSPCWCIELNNCVHVKVDRLNVLSRVVANNDGIDIEDCHNITISNCTFDCSDDAICPKSSSSFGVRNLTVTNCIIKSESNGIKFGTTSIGGFYNVTISNCVIYDTRLSGIALEVVDGGTMENICIGNITMDKVNGGIFIKLGQRKGNKPGVLKDVIIHDVIATGIGLWQPDTSFTYYKQPKGSPLIGMTVLGLPGYEVENIVLSNIYLQFAGGGSNNDTEREIKDTPSIYPEYTNSGITPAYGINVKNAKKISFNNIRLDFLKEDLRPAFYLKNVEEAELNLLKMKISQQAKSFIKLEDVENIKFDASTPVAETVPFLELKGTIKDISFAGKDLEEVKQPNIIRKIINKSEIKNK